MVSWRVAGGRMRFPLFSPYEGRVRETELSRFESDGGLVFQMSPDHMAVTYCKSLVLDGLLSTSVCIKRHEGNGSPTPFIFLSLAGLALVESQQTDPGARISFDHDDRVVYTFMSVRCGGG